MHIVFVTPEFVTEMKGGGLASYIANISQILDAHGHKISIITLSNENDDFIRWKNNICVYRVKRNLQTLVAPLDKLFLSWRLYLQEKELNRKEKIDLIQYASYDSVGFFHLQKVPAVVRISSDSVTCREYKFYDLEKRKLKLYFTDWMEYYTEKKIGNIFGPSYATGKLIENRIHKKVTIIESPFILNKESYDFSVYDAILRGKKYYLAHSSMSCLKGTHIIAEIIQDVCKIDETAYFVFAGNDQGIYYSDGAKISAQDYIMKCAGEYKEKVIFLGTLERSKLYPIIKGAYACLMPSRIDNMPNTCIEAMAMGKIVVGTRGASYDQLIENGKNGFLIEIDSRAELKDTINKINLLSDQKRQEISRKAQKTTERFNAENSYYNIMEFYKTVIKNSKHN